MYRLPLCVIVSTLIFTTAFSPIQSSPAPTSASLIGSSIAQTGRAFVVGDVSTQPDAVTPLLLPIAEYLAANLEGYTHGEVAVAPDLEAMSAFMTEGTVDLYFDSSYPSVIVSEQSGARIILRQWSSGGAEYHSVFFALQDSGFTGIQDLAGRVVAFDKSVSTSGYFLPSYYLLTQGFSLVEADSFEAIIPDNTVGYIFSNEDVNTFNWVITGRVAAGVTNNLAYADIPQEARDHFIILGETQSLPSQVASVRPSMSEAEQEQLIALLIGMDEIPEGQAALEQANTVQFDEFPQGIDAFTALIDEMLSTVEGR